MAIAFQNKTQSSTYHTIESYLCESQLFHHSVVTDPEQPKFSVTHGSAQVTIEVLNWEVHPWESGEMVIVKACSSVTTGSTLTPELLRYLLQENTQMRFGAFQINSQGDVLFAHTVLGGDNMDLRELQSCILSVVTIADTYDDLIVEQFGGQRAVDTQVTPSL